MACLKEAKKLGTPDSENITCKALIFSAVVAYARPFKTGVRGADETTWRVAGIGFTALNIIGLTASIVEAAIVQTSKMLELLADTLDQKRKALYKAQCDLFAQNGKWEAARLVRLPSRANVSKSRR